MDFLRRLHPGHGYSAGAASLDLPPRWGAGAEVARPSPAGMRAPLPAAPPADDDPRVRGAEVPPSRRQRAAPHTPQPPGPSTPPPDSLAPAHRPPLRRAAPVAPAGPAPGSRHLVVAREEDHTLPLARHDTAPVVQRASGIEAAVAGPARRAADSAAARPQAPLRPQALQQAHRAPNEAAVPIVHVTIDRIDVRAPPPVTGQAPARKPRTTSMVAPLADYLRPQGGGR